MPIPLNGQTTSNHTKLSTPSRSPLDFGVRVPLDMSNGSSRRAASGHQILPSYRQDFIRIPSAGGCQKGAGSRDCTGEVSPNPTPPPPGAQGAPGRSPARAGQRNTRDRGPENQQELKNRYGQPLTLSGFQLQAANEESSPVHELLQACPQ